MSRKISIPFFPSPTSLPNVFPVNIKKMAAEKENRKKVFMTGHLSIRKSAPRCHDNSVTFRRKGGTSHSGGEREIPPLLPPLLTGKSSFVFSLEMLGTKIARWNVWPYSSLSLRISLCSVPVVGKANSDFCILTKQFTYVASCRQG